MKRHYILLYFFLLALLALTGIFMGCSTASAAAPQEDTSVLFVADAGYVVPATNYTLPDSGDNNKDPVWRQYVGRGQAFANCPPPTRSSGKKAAKPAKPRRSAGKKKAAPVVKPPVDLFPEPICPDGCVPAPRKTQAGLPADGGTPDGSGQASAASAPAAQQSPRQPEGQAGSASASQPPVSQPPVSQQSEAAPARQDQQASAQDSAPAAPQSAPQSVAPSPEGGRSAAPEARGAESAPTVNPNSSSSSSLPAIEGSPTRVEGAGMGSVVTLTPPKS